MRLRVAAAALNQTPLDWDGNRQRCLAAIDEAREQGAHVLCLPELGITGYGCEDAFQAPGVLDTAWEMLESMLPHTLGLVVSFGLPVMCRHALYNCAALVVDGKLVGLVAKRALAGDGLHYEPRWFKPWPKGVSRELPLADGAVPIGDLLFDVGGVQIGFEICEDAWVADRPGVALSQAGVDIILNPSASHFAFGKLAVRERFVVEGSRAFGCAYVYANLLGNEAGRAIYDGGVMIASDGKLDAVGPRFSFQPQLVTSATVDVARARMGHARTHSFRPTLTDEGPRIVRVAHAWGAAPAGVNRPIEVPAWERSPHHKAEEFVRAMTLGLLDYARKSHSRGFVVSLSGGADSALCVVLVKLMAERAIQELGLDAAVERLGLGRALPAGPGRTREALLGALLTTAYQATKNSGHVTRDAARTVAVAVGAVHHELDVDALVDGYVGLVEDAIGRRLEWARDDIALQNIQARARAPSVWMLANLSGALLLATSNRSEAAVGYATMDGDTAGGLSPIAGIDKAFILKLLAWLEVEGPVGLGPLPALAVITRQAPTAELRPAAQAQTDEKDLMPYTVLDAIERRAIRDKEMPVEVWEGLVAELPRYTPAELGLWVERFFRLWCRNQWKRERYAPSFHLDDENLDPKTWCRFPILSGGFERELKALAARVAAAGR